MTTVSNVSMVLSYKTTNVKKPVPVLTMLMLTPKLVNHVPLNVKNVTVPPKTNVPFVFLVSILKDTLVTPPVLLVNMPTVIPELVIHVTLPV